MAQNHFFHLSHLKQIQHGDFGIITGLFNFMTCCDVSKEASVFLLLIHASSQCFKSSEILFSEFSLSTLLNRLNQKRCWYNQVDCVPLNIKNFLIIVKSEDSSFIKPSFFLIIVSQHCSYILLKEKTASSANSMAVL